MVRLVRRMHIWVKSIYMRITLTKTILAFFLFNFAHCFAQALVQSFLFTLDSNANALTSAIVSTAAVPQNEFAWLDRQHDKSADATMYTLKLCDAIPYERNAGSDPCTIIFQSDETNVAQVSTGFRRSQSDPSISNVTLPLSSSLNPGPAGRLVSSIGAVLQPVLDSSGNITGVELTQAGLNDGRTTFLNAQCAKVSLYADQVLKNSKREELALIGSEFWLLGISIFAIMSGSIPHLFAGLAFRVLSTGWSAYSIWRTHDIDSRFDALLVNGACSLELFPGYFRTRTAIQIIDVVLNVVALLLLIWMVTRLVRTYTTIMFRCLGPPDHVAKMHRLLLGLSTCLQLSVYVLITSTSLWVDQLVTGAIASMSTHTTLYLTLVVLTLALLVPWLVVGWRSLCHERPRTFLLFLGTAVLLEACWSAMYDSSVWRWTWIQWPFFGAMTVAAQLVLLATIVLGVACRMNFGKGLKEYLQAANALEKEDFEPEIFERTGSPSSIAEKGGWVSDAERQRVAERLSRTLDFGAHQPPPPMSPPSYDAHVLASVATPPQTIVRHESREYLLSRVTLPTNAARPLSFSTVLPSLPSLGKHDPWQSAKGKDGKDEFSGQQF